MRQYFERSEESFIIEYRMEIFPEKFEQLKKKI